MYSVGDAQWLMYPVGDKGGEENHSQQAIGYQKEIKKTLGKTSETDAYLKFEMTSYVKCQTDL